MGNQQGIQPARSLRLAAAALAAWWLALGWHLAPVWSADPQYHFGWLCALVVPLLLHRRWITRPMPDAECTWMPAAVAWACCVVFSPAWLLAQPNPDWRFVNWTIGGSVIILSLCAAWWLGGRRWVLHFAMPLCVVLAAIPWPSVVENAVVQGASRIVSDVCVEALNLLGIAAIAHGSVIELSSGSVGVDDACSGIRSLQASVFAALAIGELFRIRSAQRVLLLAVAVLAAFLGNLLRAFVLALVAARHGPGALEKWHDPAGFTIFALSLLVTWCVAMRLSQARVQVPSEPQSPRVPGVIFSCALLAWLMATIAGTEAWFRAHEPRSTSGGMAAAAAWEPQFPEGAPQFQRLAIPPRVARMLRHDEGQFVQWLSDEGEPWFAYYFRWHPGPVRTRLAAQIHRPDVCLPAIGCTLTSGPRTIEMQTGGTTISFLAYTFRQEPGQTLHVFQVHQRDGDGSGEWSRKAGIRAALEGRRRSGHQMLQFIIYSPRSAGEIESALRRKLPGMIREVPPMRVVH